MTKQEQVYEIVQAFITKQEIVCSEAIYQNDRIIENACDFIDSLCSVVGFYVYEEED